MTTSMTTDRPRTSTRALAIGLSRRGMTLSLVEGLLSAGYFAFMERWLTPLLQNRLGAERQAMAMVLSNLPMFTSIALGAVMGVLVRRLGGSRRATLVSAWIQTVAFACLLPPQFAPDAPWSVPLALGAACTIAIISAVGQTGWQAWMSGLVPPAVKGRYFGRRSMAFSIAGMVYVGIYSQIITWLPISDGTAGGNGLLVVTVFALVMRTAGSITLTIQPGAPHVAPDSPVPPLHRTLRDLGHFVRHMPSHAAGPWMLMMALMMFGLGVGSPFIAMYQTAPIAKGGLGLADQPLMYAAIYWTAAIVRLSAYPLLGRAVDRFGAHAVLRWSLPGLGIIPLFWALITAPWMLMFSEMIAALSWCGVDCAVSMLLWSCHPDPHERPRIMGYQQVLNSSSMLLGGLVGTMLINALPTYQGSAFRSIFLLAFLLRITVAVLAFRVLQPRPDRA